MLQKPWRTARTRSGGAPAITDLRAAPTVRYLAERKTVLIQEDLAAADPPVPEVLLSLYKAKAQMLAPVIHDQQLIGIISVHDVRGPRKWSDADADHLHDAQQQISAGIDHDEARVASEWDLKNAGIQAVLDTLRAALGVQRCTVRQDVSEDFAFPVTYETRDESVRPLKGDLTVVQSGQPVIEDMIANQRQVVQTDSLSAS